MRRHAFGLIGFIGLGLLLAHVAGCNRQDQSQPTSSPNDPVQRVTVSDLRFVSATLFTPADQLSWKVAISPDGSSCAVYRHVGEEANHPQYRLDVDGQPGPKTFYDIRNLQWLSDGKTPIYFGKAYDPPAGNYVVVGTRTFGPFKEIQELNLDKASDNWHALTVPDNQWIDASGNVSPGSAFRIGPISAPPVMNLPTKDVNVELVDSGEPKRMGGATPKFQKLTVNHKVIGTFPSICSIDPSEPSPRGFQQADGRILFYIIEDKQLVRLYVRP